MSILASIDKSMRVLVVDDFLSMRRIIKKLLKQHGFTNIEEAPDGKIAMEMLMAGDFQMIVSDWNMPNMMGIDLLRAVRADQRLKIIPFLMVTAQSKKEDIIEAEKAGVSNYIGKPFTAENMGKTLEAIFSKKPC